MSHVRWEDLLEEDAGASPGGPAPAGAAPVEPAVDAEPAPPSQSGLDLGSAAALDPRLAQLVREREELQARMEQLVGGGGAPGAEPVDERQAKQFPILRHTAESRLAEKLEHKRETDTRLASQRVYARRRASEAEAARVEDLRRARILSTRRARDRQRQEAERRAARERREAAMRKVVHRAIERAAEAAFGKGERADLHAIRARAASLVRSGAGAADIAPLRKARTALGQLDRPLALPAMDMRALALPDPDALSMPMDLGSVGGVGEVGGVADGGDAPASSSGDDGMTMDTAPGGSSEPDPMAMDSLPTDPAAIAKNVGFDPANTTPRMLMERVGVRAPRADDMRVDRLARRARDLFDRPRKRGKGLE